MSIAILLGQDPSGAGEIYVDTEEEGPRADPVSSCPASAHSATAARLASAARSETKAVITASVTVPFDLPSSEEGRSS